MIKIIIVDDYKTVRDSLKWLLEAESEFEVVGESATGAGVVDLVDQLSPDVVILDIGLPDITGLDVLQHLGKRTESTCVIMLSMFADQEHVAEAFNRGAKAYILKDHGATDLTHAIREVLAGRNYLSPL